MYFLSTVCYRSGGCCLLFPCSLTNAQPGCPGRAVGSLDSSVSDPHARPRAPGLCASWLGCLPVVCCLLIGSFARARAVWFWRRHGARQHIALFGLLDGTLRPGFWFGASSFPFHRTPPPHFTLLRSLFTPSIHRQKVRKWENLWCCLSCWAGGDADAGWGQRGGGSWLHTVRLLFELLGQSGEPRVRWRRGWTGALVWESVGEGTGGERRRRGPRPALRLAAVGSLT